MKRDFIIRCLILLAAVVTAVPAFAQQSGKVTFSLLDAKTRSGVMGAVVEVYPTAKPDKKRYYTSGAGGAVEISGLAYGSYTLVATFLGYDDLTKEFRLAGESLNLGRLTMKEGSTKIDMVVKSAKSLRASQNGDTLSYNAGAFKVTSDADVEGLLKKMPGITVNNGEVEAQGETIQKVFVDGKEFFGDDVNTAIKSLPAEAVDRIEVFNKLSDQAEFSGVDDGEGYKALNIITKEGMRHGWFGKAYAGYGYQPETDDITSNHKYTVGGNINYFQGDSRLSLIGLFNNINQQNFSFEDILGVSGSTGGGGRGFRGAGQYMVRPQEGVALVNSVGLNFSDTWGRRDQVKFQGSYFFNNTNTQNLSTNNTWYDYPKDTLHKQGHSKNVNNNHRLNLRLDWKISRNQSLMSRTNVSYQGYDSNTSTEGYKFGNSGLSYSNDGNSNRYYGVNVSEFLQYRLKIGKPGRTMTLDGRFNYRDNHSNRYTSANDADAIAFDEAETSDYVTLYDQYVASGNWQAMAKNPLLYSPIYRHITSPTRTYNVNGRLTYNEPITQSLQFTLQYRLSYEAQDKEQSAFDTPAYGSDKDETENVQMTKDTRSGYWTHRVGPGLRWSRNRNTLVGNVYYQYSSLDGTISSGGKSDPIKGQTFHNVTYFGMANIAFNKENSIRMFFRSRTESPSITQLQDIYDVSTPQYLSIGNKGLKPSFSHNINFHYIHSNLEKGRTFMWMFSMQNQQNYISGSTYYNQDRTEVTIDSESYRPQQITSYENMDGYWNLRTHVSLGLPLTFMKCNLNLMAGVTYNITPAAIYKSLDDMVSHEYLVNKAKNLGYNASVTLGSNISEKIDFTLSWNGGYNQAWNTSSLMKQSKNDYFSHTASGSLKWVFWKGFTFTASCSYVQYVGFTDDYNESYVLCNAYLGKKVFRNQLGEVQIGVNDIFNQNTAFVRNTGSGYTQNLTNSVIGRYFSVQFVYNLRAFGKRGSKNAKDYDYQESKGSVGMSQGNSGTRMWGPR